MCGNTHSGGERLIQLRQFAEGTVQLKQNGVGSHYNTISYIKN